MLKNVFVIKTGKNYAQVEHTSYLMDICVCNDNVYRHGNFKFKEVKAKQMAQDIADGLNLINKIRSENLNNLTKAQLIELLTLK